MTTDRDIILRLLKDTAAAHGKHEAEELGGVFDEQWPEWYSTYMTDRLHEEGYRLVDSAP
ncbi:MAG: hypothetical protein ABI566_11680 [Pseudolysinimonas sp.]